MLEFMDEQELVQEFHKAGIYLPHERVTVPDSFYARLQQQNLLAQHMAQQQFQSQRQMSRQARGGLLGGGLLGGLGF